ncbi:hypothetical protein [Flavobacterium sp.]|uniref:hypothetical protein n=1 Tax=Flavobacterium sp. TaxID=239 RepID=UPI003753C58E
MENKDFEILTNYILSYNSLDCLNTDLIEEWTTELINLGHKSDAIYMLASFSKPIVFYEIESYLKSVFRELNLKENDKIQAQKSYINYHLNEIVNLKNIRSNLREIADLYYDCNSDLEITDFYLLYLAWDELEEIGVNYYYENVDLKTIEATVIEKAKSWLGFV